MLRYICWLPFLFLLPSPAIGQSYDFVQSFTLTGNTVVGNSAQFATGTIVVNRAADGGGANISVGVGAPSTLVCQFGNVNDGCDLPPGTNTTTFTASFINPVTTSSTFNVHVYVDFTPDPGLDQSLTVIPANYTLSVSPSSTLGDGGVIPIMTLNRTPPPLGAEPIYVEATTGGGYDPGAVTIPVSGTAQVSIQNNSIFATTDTVTYCASLTGGPPCAATTTLTFTPISLTLSFSPGSIMGETASGVTSQTGTGIVSINSPVGQQITISCEGGMAGLITSPYLCSFPIPAGSTSATFQFWGGYLITPDFDNIAVMASTVNGYATASAPLTIYPAAASPMGPCKRCENAGGNPIDFTDGNVWIQEKDYSLPGLGGGLALKRTWNSLWSTSTQINYEGMFGRNWWSTYEEKLWVGNNPVEYYRSDGNVWYFAQDPTTGAYLLYSPADERASLSFSSLTSTYTLSFMDGSARIFNNNGYLTALIDRNGNQVTLTYDGSNRVTQVTDAASRSITFAYGDSSDSTLVTSVQDSVGTIATYTYDPYSRLTEVQYADGSSLNFAYSGWMISTVTDGNGKTLESHTYDSYNHGLTSQRADGADAVTVSYNSSNQTVVDDSFNNATTYTFSGIMGQYYMASIAGSGCASCGGRGNQSMSYDSYGNLSSRTDANSVTTSYTYDLYGDVLTKSVALNSTTTLTWTYTYNGFGEVLTATDPAGNVTTNTYDANGNLLSTTTPPPSGTGPGSTTSFTYDTKGELLTVTDPLSHVTTMAYTAAGLLASVKDAQNNQTTYTYDARGNRLTMTDPASNVTSYTYDSMNRLTKITYPDSSTSTFAYDSRGRRTSATDQNGKTTSYAYDDADRLTSVTDAASNVTQYAYDTENNLTSIADANSHTTSFNYDAYGRVTKTTFPSTLTETYAYDGVGNLTSKTDRKGQTINYSYDALDRLTQKSYPDSTTVAYTYDNLGNVTQVADPSGTYGFSYDHMNRLTGTSTQYSFLTNTFTNSYSYDAASNRTGYTAPDSSTNTYSYDSLNRLTTLANSWAGSFGFSYDALSRRTQMTRPNGVNTNYTYDSLSRLLSVLHQSGGGTIDGAAYTLDAAGNRTAKTDELANVTSNYGYDAIYELTAVTQGTNTTESYSYDPVGNRTASLGVASYTVNSSNELTATPSATYAYDNNGNTTSKTDSTGTTTYTWDFENRLTSVALPASGGTVTFKYDPFGRRVYKQSPSATSIFAYDGDDLVETVNGSGSEVAGYALSQNIDEPLAMQRGSTTNYYEADGIGSITSLTGSSGTVAQSYTYDSFGNTTNSSGSLTNFLRYTARDFDTETKLYYNRARYFDPASGRFISEDPIGFGGGINRYAYTMNMPIDWVDPSGLAMSAAECAKLLKSIQERASTLAKKMDKYDPIRDGLGGEPYSAGGKTGITRPGSHFAQIVGMQATLWIDIFKYQNNCGGRGPQIPCDVFKVVNRKVSPPVIPKTLFELQMDEQAAEDTAEFWNQVLMGDLALGLGYGLGELAPVLGISPSALGMSSAPALAVP